VTSFRSDGGPRGASLHTESREGRGRTEFLLNNNLRPISPAPLLRVKEAARVITVAAIVLSCACTPRREGPPAGARRAVVDVESGAPAIRLLERLADARRLVAPKARVHAPRHDLDPRALVAPPGWRRTLTADGAARFDADGDGAPRPFALALPLPITPGRDHLVAARVRDPAEAARLLVEHLPTPELPQRGFQRATVERAPGGVARFDWRVEIPADTGAATVEARLVADRAQSLTVEALSVREAIGRDPQLVTPAPAATLRVQHDAPIAGARAVGPRPPRRLVDALLATDGSLVEWALAPTAPRRFTVETAVARPGAPVELRVEVERPSGRWEALLTQTRGAEPADGAASGWRPWQVDLPADARALRLVVERRATPTSAAAPAVVAWGAPTLAPAARPALPHVLLITLDAVRPDHLGMYGARRATSPFLDGLARRGVRFEDVVAQRGHTWASTTSLLTGLLPSTSGVVARGARPQRGLPSAVAAFQRAGYLTVRIGSPDLPRAQIAGFDRIERGDFDTELLERFTALADDAHARPLFVWLHLANAHYPYRVAPEANRFDPTYTGPHRDGLDRETLRALLDAPDGPPEAERRHLEALYDASILQMDQRLGRALATAEERGLLHDAILAVTADHGAHFGEHDVWVLHATPWPQSLRVPLFFVAPGRLPAERVIAAASGRALLVDVMPTLLDLAGVAPTAPLDGVSLVPAARDGARVVDRTTVTGFQPATYVLVENERYALLWNPTGEPLAWPGELARTVALPRVALFDRVADPGFTRDLTAERPLVVGALRAAATAARDPRAAATLSTEARQLLMQAGYLDEPLE